MSCGAGQSEETFSGSSAGAASPAGTPDRLEEVARVYRQAWTRGGAPTRAVAEHFDKSLSFAAKLVTQARSAGLLPKTRAGKAWAGTPPGGDDAQ